MYVVPTYKVHWQEIGSEFGGQSVKGIHVCQSRAHGW